MSSFYNIIHKDFPFHNTNFIINEINEKKRKFSFIDHMFINEIYKCFYYEYNSDTNINNKFEVLQMHLNNSFIDESKKTSVLNKFCKAQKTYRILCRLAYNYKRKKSHVYNCDTDLFLNPLTKFKMSLLITLYDNERRTLYNFRLSDLIGIINASLSNSPEFFVDPLLIRNPYTNIPFSRATLYNIYFAIKKSSLDQSILFHLFFLVNFNLRLFSLKYEAFIRDYVINNFMNNTCSNEKYYYIRKLFTVYDDILAPIVFDRKFPVNKIISAFSEFIPNFLNSLYSLNPSNKFYHGQKLVTKLTRFVKLNPRFGQKLFPIDISNSFFNPIDISNAVIYQREQFVDIVNNISPRVSQQIQQQRGRSVRRTHILPRIRTLSNRPSITNASTSNASTSTSNASTSNIIRSITNRTNPAPYIFSQPITLNNSSQNIVLDNQDNIQNSLIYLDSSTNTNDIMDI